MRKKSIKTPKMYLHKFRISNIIESMESTYENRNHLQKILPVITNYDYWKFRIKLDVC